MDFQHSQDRQMLADSLGRYLRNEYTIVKRLEICASESGWSKDHWAKLAELGIVGAMFSEDAGGFAGTGFDIGVVFEQLGKALVVEPFLGTLMAGRVLAQSGEHSDLIEQVISGETLIAFAYDEAQSRYDLTATTTEASNTAEGWTLTGAKAVVPQLAAADQLVVAARSSGKVGDSAGISLYLVAKDATGLEIKDYPMIDGGHGGDLTLNATPATLIGAVDAGFDLAEEAIAAGIVALSWEAVGVMDTLKDSTLDYLRQRKQFGVAIGKFQVLQHRMATVALEIEQARSAAINAADALEGDRHSRERAISAAKYTIGRVGTLVAEEAIQLHGGIGMTWELPLSHYAKRLTMIGHQLGDEDFHLSRYSKLGHAA